MRVQGLGFEFKVRASRDLYAHPRLGEAGRKGCVYDSTPPSRKRAARLASNDASMLSSPRMLPHPGPMHPQPEQQAPLPKGPFPEFHDLPSDHSTIVTVWAPLIGCICRRLRLLTTSLFVNDCYDS